MGSRDSFLSEGDSTESVTSAGYAKSSVLETSLSHQASKNRLPELFSENITAKVLRAALDQLSGNVGSLLSLLVHT